VKPAAASWCSDEVGLPSTTLPGTYVVRDNFESGTLGKWRKTDEGDAWAGVTADYAWAGDCAGRLVVTSSSSSRANIRAALPAGTTDVWAVGRFRVLAEGYSGSNVPTFRFFNGSARIADVHRQNGSGDLWLRTASGDGSWRYVNLGSRMEFGRWYRIDVHVRTAWSGSIVEVRLNRTTIYSNGAYYLPAGRLTTTMIGAEHVKQQMDLLFDSVVIKAS
jgi:hypothetical protein